MRYYINQVTNTNTSFNPIKIGIDSELISITTVTHKEMKSLILLKL